jgi:hypothetical protein
MFVRSKALVRCKPILLLSLLLLSIFVCPEAKAACKYIPINWDFGNSTPSKWRITNHTTCDHWFAKPENVASLKIARKPSHGSVGKDGIYGFAYVPQQTFKGTDRFAVLITSNSNCICGGGKVATIEVEVEVE